MIKNPQELSEATGTPIRPEITYAAYVPAGPNVEPEFLADTIQSVLTCVGPETLVLVGDDSGKGLFSEMAGLGPNVHVRSVPIIDDAPNAYTVLGKFFLKKVRLQRALLAEFHFDRLLNLDDDALVLNSNFIQEAERLFSTRKRAGILGRYSLNHEFQPLPFEGQAERMYIQMSRNPLRGRRSIPIQIQPKLRSIMRPLLQSATANGYTLGTSFIGGSFIITRECLTAISRRPEIDIEAMKHSPCPDDDLFTVFCYACGYRVYDFLTDPPIFHIDWRRLTMSPQELIDIGASVIHSVRDPAYGGEAVIREFFRKHRTENGKI